jgi:phosphoesterase RecJ-like protein
MADYRSNITLSDVVRVIRSATRILVTTHAKPDGDAYGSVAAMFASLRRLMPDAKVAGWLMGPVLPCFKGLHGWAGLREFDEAAAAELGEPDLIIVLDTGAWAQVAPMRRFIEPRVGHTLIIDHHISGDIPARHMFIDSAASACCSVLADVLDAIADFDPSRSRRLADQNPLFVDPAVTESLFAGIASDTGWFRFSNTTAQTHLLAARLIRAGVDQAGLYAKLEQAERPEKLALQIRAMQSLKLLANKKVAMMVLHAVDFKETGALAEETERFVDIPQAVESVKMVVLITEPPTSGDERKPAIRVSFRSKPGKDALNVAEFAAQFGGGGHARASGAKIEGALDEVVKRIEAAVAMAVK